MEADVTLLSTSWWVIILGGIGTLAIYSFLYKENPFYRIFEHLYIGIATGLGITSFVRSFIWPQVLKPLLGLDLIQFPDGTYFEPYDNHKLLYLIPIAFGGLYYFIYSTRYNWLAQLVIGFSLGLGGGSAFKATFSEMFPQVTDSFRPLYIPGDIAQSVSNCIFIFILLTASSYFLFTFSRKPGGLVERSSTLGRWMLMGCFGAFFGSTIMARMALLVERLQFLIEQWGPTIMHTL